jgi:hypothetical protein
MDEPEDIVAIINTFRELHQHGILQNNPALRNIVAWSSMNKRRDEIWDGEGAIPHWRLRQLQKESGLGYWMARFGFYGPKDLIEKRLSITKEVLARMAPGSRLKSYLFEGSEGDLVDAASIPTPLGGGQVGVPDMWTLPSVQYRCRPGGDGIGAHTDFSPILPLDGNDVLEWFNTSKQIMEEQGFDLYCGGHIHPRYMILINMMVFDKTNPHQRETVERIFGDLSRKAKKHGISKYRAHINQMGML